MDRINDNELEVMRLLWDDAPRKPGEIQEEFGWDPFKKVFAEYNVLPEAEWPKSQQEKNDQFIIRLSKACGKNLAPFWKKWNLPLTPKVDQELAGLEVWVSDGLPK